jgi:hypothetical protein
MRGLVLTRLNRTEEAIKAFADITRDYPQLPEPYNNLAVLYAAQGDYDKARDALQAAIAKHPSYATAHENLGDIYAALAAAAYGKAAALDTGDQAVRRKLAVINQLDTDLGIPATASAAPSAPATAAPAAAAAAPVAAAKPAPAEAPKSGAAAARDAAALAQVQAWAQAWARQDVDAYLSMYAPEFAPEGGVSRETWAAQRRDRIATPKKINVRVIDPQASDIEDGAVRVSFTQAYESDTYSDSVSKVLELVPVDGSWKIVREYTR